MNPMDYQMEHGHPEIRSGAQNTQGRCPALNSFGHFSPFSMSTGLDAGFRSRDGFMASPWAAELPGPSLPSIHHMYANSTRPRYSPSSGQATLRPRDQGENMITDGLDPTAPVYRSPQRQDMSAASPSQGSSHDPQSNVGNGSENSTRSGPSMGESAASRLPNLRQGFDHHSNPHFQSLYPAGYNPSSPYPAVNLPQHALALPLPSGLYHNYLHHPPWTQNSPQSYSPGRSTSAQNSAAATPTAHRAHQVSSGSQTTPTRNAASQSMLSERERPRLARDSEMSSEESDDGSLDDISQILPGIRSEHRALLGMPPGQLSVESEMEREHAREILRAARRSMQISASAKLVASPAAIASFERVEKSSLDTDDQTCIICYNEFGIMNPDGNIECPVRLPKCKHLFGDHCLKQWLKDSDSCPYCRDKLDSTPKKPSPDSSLSRHRHSTYLQGEVGLEAQRNHAYQQQLQLERDRHFRHSRNSTEPRPLESASARRDMVPDYSPFTAGRSSERGMAGDISPRHRRGRASGSRSHHHSSSARTLQTQQQMQFLNQQQQQYRENLIRLSGPLPQHSQSEYQSIFSSEIRRASSPLSLARPALPVVASDVSNTSGDSNNAQPRSITPYPMIDGIDPSSPEGHASTSAPRPTSLPATTSTPSIVSSNSDAAMAASPIDISNHRVHWTRLPSIYSQQAPSFPTTWVPTPSRQAFLSHDALGMPSTNTSNTSQPHTISQNNAYIEDFGSGRTPTRAPETAVAESVGLNWNSRVDLPDSERSSPFHM